MGLSDIDVFLKKIMNIRVMRAGGAAAGVFGQSGADNDVVNNLMRNALTFANEYRRAKADHQTLQRLANELEGSLRVLQLTRTLSDEDVTKLTDELYDLLNDRQN